MKSEGPGPILTTVKSLTLEPGAHREEGHPERLFISLNGQPFYRSSGHNSYLPGTWFPFFGRLEEDLKVWPFMARGWFIKPNQFIESFPQELKSKVDELYPPYYGDSIRDILFARANNVPCLLISSWIGGGLWDEPKGQELKQYLQEKYPAFYQKAPKLTLLPAVRNYNTPEEMNEYLCQKANISNYNDLTKFTPNTIEDIQFSDGIDSLSTLEIYEHLKKSEKALEFVTKLSTIDPQAFELIQQFSPTTAEKFSQIIPATFTKMMALEKTEQRIATLIGIAKIYGQEITLADKPRLRLR